jgi:DNA adenine methylase
VKPPFAYYGGKARLAPWIVSLMPPHQVYVEPCLGAGAVFFAKPPTEHEIINDLDRALVTFFRMLRDQPAELIRLCELTPYARAEHAAADTDEPGLDDLEVARRWWATVNQSFNKTGRHHNGFSASAAAGAGEAKSTKRRLERLHLVAARLRDAVIECRPAAELVPIFDTPRTVFYVDPPYVADSRKNTHTAYLHEMSDDDHRHLAAVLSETRGTVLVSGYESALYDEIFAGWHRTTTTIIKRTSNRLSATREPVTEVVWSNRPLDEGRLFGASA